MLELHLIQNRDLRWTPWKNGGGRTRELAVWPAGASMGQPQLGWRLARAECSQPGPFSSFPGFDRLLVPLDRDLGLRHESTQSLRRVRRGECARFAGEWSTHVELPEGPARDLNLLCARGQWNGTLAWLPLARRRVLEEFDRGHLVLHLVEGALRVRATGAEEARQLQPGDTLWLHGARAGDAVELSGEHDATCVVVARIEPTGGARD